ncbi:20S proteasome subunit beta type 7 [Guillardia theta CCMP2712]|uniref:Proteasome subunit beta n=1 Tax=Guillardia theta (strain CCMP2712) TaxID=905079 RepID=L1J4E9_GUITC|nr:20S proteasome subunit beta type 7 [Guillardia theta CCMP2712]EKX43371.1 20S proteasome subunit beta type 7 [Guillardia theta CCMP2712]|eukprot:XP_005830351.1 20S proteasome subunit beta type 7 [Guillardia theta CCMP2712]
MEASLEIPKGGFSFDLCKRNAWLESQANYGSSSIIKKAKKTGTTIAGIIFKDGVVLGADTRATSGPIVADKNCEKIHYLAPNIFCCGAGTSADCENVTEMMASNLTLHRLNTGRECRVITAVTMLSQYLFRYQGYISAALVVGGVDSTGPSLYTIHPHGSVDQLPFVTMGSGSLAAMAVFEAGYQEGLERQPGIDLVRAAIQSGIDNDLGSGSNVDITVITPEGVQRFRNLDKAEPKYKSKNPLFYPKGTTKYYDEIISKVAIIEGDAMEQ